MAEGVWLDRTNKPHPRVVTHVVSVVMSSVCRKRKRKETVEGSPLKVEHVEECSDETVICRKRKTQGNCTREPVKDKGRVCGRT